MSWFKVITSDGRELDAVVSLKNGTIYALCARMRGGERPLVLLDQLKKKARAFDGVDVMEEGVLQVLLRVGYSLYTLRELRERTEGSRLFGAHDQGGSGREELCDEQILAIDLKALWLRSL